MNEVRFEIKKHYGVLKTNQNEVLSDNVFYFSYAENNLSIAA